MRQQTQLRDDWNITLLRARHRARRRGRHQATGAWAASFVAQAKSLWTLQRHYSTSCVRHAGRSLTGWADFVNYHYQRHYAEEHRLRATLLPHDSPDQWSLFLRRAVSDISGWYRNRGLALEAAHLRYRGDERDWRQAYVYLSKWLGDKAQRATPWNRLFYSVMQGLVVRHKAKIKPSKRSHNSDSFSKYFKSARARLFSEINRQTPSWDNRLNNSSSYLALMERKRHGKKAA